MRTEDLASCPCAEDRRACERRSAMMGAIGALGLVLIAWATAYPGRPVQAAAPNTYGSELSTFAKTLERGGRLSGLEILW